MSKTHYRKLMNPDYLGAYDFTEKEERLVTIASVKTEQVIGPDGKKDECIVARFKEAYKPMILNSTNCKMITKLTGSAFIEDWYGKQVRIYVAQVRAFGEMVDALRIKSEVIAPLPELVAGSENFVKCKDAIKSGQFTIEQVKRKYSVSADVEAALVG